MEKELVRNVKVECCVSQFATLEALKHSVEAELLSHGDDKSDYDRGARVAYISVIDCIDTQMFKLKENLRKRYKVVLCPNVVEVIQDV